MTTLRRDLFSDGTVAHVSLQGQVTADRFAQGRAMRVAAPVADLWLTPGRTRLDRQVLQGHRVCLLNPDTGFSRDEATGYVGLLDLNSVTDWVAPTHRVRAQRSLLFSAPDIKAIEPLPVSCGALLTVVETQGRFAQVDTGLFALADHLVPIDTPIADWVGWAEALLGTPYLWGGNSAFGIDCSGLVQLALQAAHRPCPGDTDQQMAQLGQTLPEGTQVQRGDLLFWKGHVAIAASPEMLIHANAGYMAVAHEPVAAAIARIAAQGDGPVLAHKRLRPLP